MIQNRTSLSINVLHKLYREGKLTPSLLCQDIKSSIESYDDYNIWIHTLNDDELQSYLSKLENKGPDDLPLYGIPFAIKDNIDLAGIPTTAACKEYSYIPQQSAFVVQLLIDAGAIPIGKTNLDQFATGLVGTRSPYGAVKNAYNPDIISGGSSSGSAVALALGQVSFSLGTDTAGSGRVPAALNNLVGLKPSKGRISSSGVVPACRSLDCVSIFANSVQDAEHVFNLVDKYDPNDSYAKKDRACIKTFNGKIGVPLEPQLAFYGNEGYKTCFDTFIKKLVELSYEITRIDFSSFTEAAALLYEGPWVAERYTAIESFIASNPDALHPVTKDIILPAKQKLTVDAFTNIYRLQELKREADKIIDDVDFIVTPTIGSYYTIDEVMQDPISLNSNLGYYTNFMNLLDYAAIAIPAGVDESQFPFGVTLFSERDCDPTLLSIATTIMNDLPIDLDKLNQQQMIDIAVCGAHLSGMPLNHQLTDRGAILLKQTKTAPDYRLYALAGGPPFRPGLIFDEQHGCKIEVEVWRMPVTELGSFIKGIPHPLGIGKIFLEDNTQVSSFICEAYAVNDAEDISHFGGWRRFIENQQPS